MSRQHSLLPSKSAIPLFEQHHQRPSFKRVEAIFANLSRTRVLMMFSQRVILISTGTFSHSQKHLLIPLRLTANKFLRPTIFSSASEVQSARKHNRRDSAELIVFTMTRHSCRVATACVYIHLFSHSSGFFSFNFLR
jgi:hypothetical protein